MGTQYVYDVVSDYGADNTGSTSASTAIQNAVNAAAAAGGGVVFAPAGTYKITIPISLSTGVRITGAGPATFGSAATKFVIDHSGGNHDACFRRPNSTSITGWSVANLCIDFTACCSGDAPSTHDASGDCAGDIGFWGKSDASSCFCFSIEHVCVKRGYGAYAMPPAPSWATCRT